LQQISNQLAIAIQQSQLYQTVQQLNSNLEELVQERTALFQRALEFEALLKRITDKVRDSLDEAQILKTAVRELALGLDTYSCDTGLYDLEHQTFTVIHEYVRHPVPPVEGQSACMADYPELYVTLLQGHYLQFCWFPNQIQPIRQSPERFSVLVHPLMDDQGIIGDLWLYRPAAMGYEELEIRLVEQVASQCAIALRQSRLYQTSQAQVLELERLNMLKDDFLSTVSHELRTPISNIKLATQMLEISLQNIDDLGTAERSIHRYFDILKYECQREISLINDLLDLNRLDAECDAIALTQVDLAALVERVSQPFIEQTDKQCQHFQIDLPDPLPIWITDRSYAERIVAELLNNACKYTPAGEMIALVAQVLQPTATSPQPRLQIQVTNSGVEIPQDECDRIFDKFYRIPNNDPWKHGGTGLGLALVKRQIERLQGTITVDSQRGSTQFTVTLPLLSANLIHDPQYKPSIHSLE
jgi:signal transduction histidine kinase